MISELSVSPRPANKSANITFGALLFSAAISTVLYLTADRFRGVIGLLTIAFITAAVLVYTRYISVKYYYDVTFDSSSRAVFTVRQVIGKRISTLCCIYLSSISRIEYEKREERRAHKIPFGVRKYNYTPTLIPENTIRIYSETRTEKAEIVIEGSYELLVKLSEFSREARELSALEDDE